MSSTIAMVKRSLLLFACGFVCLIELSAQNKGMLPLTGMRYVKDGIWAKTFSVKMNGEQLMGNRIPLSTEIEINLLQPTGFTVDKKKTIYPAARYSLISSKGDTLQKMSNLLLVNEGKGFTPKDLLKGLPMKFGIAEGLIQPNSKCIVSILLYDQKGKNKLRLEYPVSIAYPRERIAVIPTVPQFLAAPPNCTVMGFGLTVKNISFTIDSTVTYNPKLVYVNMQITKLGGTDVISMLQGKENFWVYDTLYNEIKTKDKVLKDVGGAMGTSSVNCTLRMPFRSKTEKPKGYIVRYRWDSDDKTQALDIIVTVK